MCDLRRYLTDREWSFKSWAWRQGFLRFCRYGWFSDDPDPMNPHPEGTRKWEDFESGWDKADWYRALDDGTLSDYW